MLGLEKRDLLGLAVPGIAWLEETTLLFLVTGLGIGVLILMFVKVDTRKSLGI